MKFVKSTVKLAVKSTLIGCIALISHQSVAASMTVDSNGGLSVFELNNPNYWFKFGGRIHADTVMYSGDQSQFPNGSTIRSGKLSFKGGVGDDWVYKLDITEADRASRTSSLSGGAGLGEAFLAYNGFDKVWIAFGQVAVPSGLESATSSNELPFLEQSLPGSAFSSDLGLGINVTWEGKMFNFSGSLVNPKAGTQQGIGGSRFSSEPVSFGGRLTFSPVHDAHVAYHTGLTYRHHDLYQLNDFNYSSKPELRSRQSPSITTNLLGAAQHYYVLDWEAAGRWGPYSASSEYFYTQISTKEDLPDLSYYGYYLMGSYVITGETKAYDFPGASIGGVKPRCKTGAWEVSVRHSYLKLLDSPSLQSVIVLPDDLVGNAYTTTIGLTWWVNQNVRFMANYSRMNYVDLITTGAQPKPNVAINAVGLRGQVSW